MNITERERGGQADASEFNIMRYMVTQYCLYIPPLLIFWEVV